MADPLCLLDTNVLLRWVKPDERDYPLLVQAIQRLLQADSHALLRPAKRGGVEHLNASARAKRVWVGTE